MAIPVYMFAGFLESGGSVFAISAPLHPPLRRGHL